MNHFIHRTLGSLAIGLFLCFFTACNVRAAGVSVSGSYEIVQKTDSGGQVKLVVRFHLVNHETHPMTLQEVLLSDFGYPSAKAAQVAPLTLQPGTCQDVSQEFVIPHAQYDQWRRGLQPRVMLELQTATGSRVSQVIRVERVPAGKGK